MTLSISAIIVCKTADQNFYKPWRRFTWEFTSTLLPRFLLTRSSTIGLPLSRVISPAMWYGSYTIDSQARRFCERAENNTTYSKDLSYGDNYMYFQLQTCIPSHWKWLKPQCYCEGPKLHTRATSSSFQSSIRGDLSYVSIIGITSVLLIV